MILLQAYRGQGVECGSLNANGLHKLIWSGTTGRCGLVRVSMALLEEVCHCGGGLWDLNAQATSSVSVHFLLPLQDAELFSYPSYIMSACTTTMPHHEDDGLNLWTVSHPIKCFPLQEFLWSWCLFTATETLTKTVPEGVVTSLRRVTGEMGCLGMLWDIWGIVPPHFQP